MYMLKNKFLLALFLLMCSTALKAQQIVIDDARFDPGFLKYTTGGTVSVPVKLNGCFPLTNQFYVQILDSTGNPAGGAATIVTQFYATSFNYDIPTTLTGLGAGVTRRYKIAITSSVGAGAGDTTQLFLIENTTTPIIAKAEPLFDQYILSDQSIFGVCDGRPIDSLVMKDSCTAGGVDSFILYDDYRGGSKSYVPSAGKFNLKYNPKTNFVGLREDAFYTGCIKTINGNYIATKSYQIANNSWNVFGYVFANNQYSCQGDTIRIGLITDTTGDKSYFSLLQNYPAAKVTIDWGSNDPAPQVENFSICNILSTGGTLKHKYNSTSCNSGSPTFNVKITVNNPFNILNGPGVTGTCAAGATHNIYPSLFAPPKAVIRSDSVVCANDTIKLKNLSDPGQGKAGAANNVSCAQLANYCWSIDNKNTPFYCTPVGKVEGRKDTAFTFNANQVGYHTVYLTVNNNYGQYAACPPHDTTRIICVDTARVTPDFKLDSATIIGGNFVATGILKDSIVACSPVFNIKNNTRRTLCVDSTQFRYSWRILDATTGPNYTEAPSSAYSFVNGTGKNSRQPSITINEPGQYYIELIAWAAPGCAADSSRRMLKYVEANGQAGVFFGNGTPTYDTIYNNCGTSSGLQINYNPNAGPNSDIFGNPTVRDTVHYSYAQSAVGSLKYKWTVTGTLSGGAPAVMGTDIQFVSPTNDTMAYPIIKFTKHGVYKVSVSFLNNCQNKVAEQYIAFRKPMALSSAPPGTDTICYNTSYTPVGFSVLPGSDDYSDVAWSSPNPDVVFNPPTGSFTPSVTVGGASLAIAQASGLTVIIKASLIPKSPSKCPTVSSNDTFYMRPDLLIADTTINVCSGTQVGYTLTKAGNVISFTWVSSPSPPSPYGNTNQGFPLAQITDVLTGNGIVYYTVYPQVVNPSGAICVGSPFTVTAIIRPNPAAPTVTLINPANNPPAMCSGDVVQMTVAGVTAADTAFGWSWASNGGRLKVMDTVTRQVVTQINKTIINTTNLSDTANFTIHTVSPFGCKGATNSLSVIVSPGPNIAAVTWPGKLKYVCDPGCDTLPGNDPGPSGTGTWTCNYTPSPGGCGSITITNPNDPRTTVCGLTPGYSYYFKYTITPAIANGCPSSVDDYQLTVREPIVKPFAGNDTIICDMTPGTNRSITLNATYSGVPQFFQWRIISQPGGGASFSAANTLNPSFTFNQIGFYVLELKSHNNDVCVSQFDTVIIRVFTKPSQVVSITANPTRTCQYTPVTFTAGIDTANFEYMGAWRFTDPNNLSYVDEGMGQNPYNRPGTNVIKTQSVSAILYSRGWAWGCKDSSIINNGLYYVDSGSVAGTVVPTTTVVCTPGTVIGCVTTGTRGSSSVTWQTSTTGPNGPWTPSAVAPIGVTATFTINQTTWIRSYISNFGCPADTSVPVQIYMPTAADVAKTGNDTILCSAATFNLTGNTPAVGVGTWTMINGAINPTVPGSFSFDPSNSFSTTTNPVLTNITTNGTYQFVWTIKQLNCPGTSDTITIINTQSISNNTINVAADTVCNGTNITLGGTVVTGGSGGSGIFKYNWEWSTDNGSTWNLGGTNAYAYSFVGNTNIWVRRVVKVDSCTSYSNEIHFVVQPKIANNVVVPNTVAGCINTIAPTFNGTVPTGGSGSYTYAWDTANIQNKNNGLWSSASVSTISYTPTSNLIDSFCVRRIVTSGKCTDTAYACVDVYPDAKSTFSATRVNDCAGFQIHNFVTNTVRPNTTYDWYADYHNVRTSLGTSNVMPAYTLAIGPDSVTIVLIANSTTVPACKSDSMKITFRTYATPDAKFSISQHLGCANSTPNSTNFVFTNNTPNKTLFAYAWNLAANGGSSLVDLPVGGYSYAGSSTGRDTIYYITLTASTIGASCPSSQFVDTIRVRTKPVPAFVASPTYQCSGQSILFTNKSVGDNLTYKWKFGDAGNTIGSTNNDTVSHIYYTNAITTYPVRIEVSNECASDSAVGYVTVEANKVNLNFNIEPTNRRQCSPSTVSFYNHSIGGTTYYYNFGLGQGSSAPSNRGDDTVTHTFTTPGVYIVELVGTTNCGSVSAFDTVFVYGTPDANFTIASTSICKGDTLAITNNTPAATSYFWNFTASTSSSANPQPVYNTSGTYPAWLIATNVHPLTTGGSLTCSDTSVTQFVTVRDTMKASFTVTPIGTSCLPYVVQLANTTTITTLPITSYTWLSGVASQTSNAPAPAFTYPALGQYNINLTVTNAGGCTYIDSQKVNVAGPIGTWVHDTGYYCNNTPINFQVNATSTDSLIINFGDTIITYPYTSSVIQHVYKQGGTYTPFVTLKANSGCTYFIGTVAPVRIDYVKAAYTYAITQVCGTSTLCMTNKSTLNQGIGNEIYDWNINGVAYSSFNPCQSFTSTGIYNVRFKVTSVSGCFDSVATAPIFVKVNDIPSISSINRANTACELETIDYSVTYTNTDPISNINWAFGHGGTRNGQTTNTIYAAAGVYYDTVTVVSSNGCSKTLISVIPITIYGRPVVSINPNTDTALCEGQSIVLFGVSSGITPVDTFRWSPPTGLNTTIGATVTATPVSLTKYVLTGYTVHNCFDTASINVDVIQPSTVTISAQPNDSLCVGDSIILVAGGAQNYTWLPNDGSLNTQIGPRVIAKPLATTNYTVYGTNSANCFTPAGSSASLIIGVGDTLHVSLGLDTVHLQGGSQYTFTPSYNSPVAIWHWMPSAEFGANSIYNANPTISVKGNTCYSLEAVSDYGCKAYDTLCIVSFCQASQVFIPNAFTPDGDGINDYFYVSASGIKSVKTFRVFNRWGQVVFERSNFTPDPYKSLTPNALTRWDGKYRSVVSPTDVYVYTCEVECVNGTLFTYTGNVSLIK